MGYTIGNFCSPKNDSSLIGLFYELFSACEVRTSHYIATGVHWWYLGVMTCVVQKCCCCCSLKAGTITIGVFYGIFSALNIAYLIRTILDSEIAAENTEMVLAQEAVHGTLVGIFVILCVLLIYGAVREKLLLLKVWFLFSFATTGVGSVIYIVLSVVYFATAPVIYAIVYSVLAVLGIVVNVYAVLIVYSFYMQVYRARKLAKIQGDAELEPMAA